MVPGSTRNWIAVNAVQQSNPQQKENTKRKHKMKTQDNLQDQIQRTSTRKRKLPILLALAMFLAASSAEATILINANEVGSNVVFSLSGSFNTASAGGGFVAAPPPGPGAIEPDVTYLQFSTSGAAGSIIVWTLPNVTGPSAFGPGGGFLQADSGASNSNLQFLPFGKGAGLLSLYTSYVSGTSLSDVMTFSGQSFSSLGITPGIYVWSWSNGAVSDNLILQIGPSYSGQVQQPQARGRAS